VTNRPPAASRRTSSRVVDDLNRDWLRLLEERPGVVGVWAARHPGLVSCDGLVDLLGRAVSGEDDVLRPLLVEVRSGDQVAGRVVVQAMLGRLVRMAGRDRWALVDDYVGALWCVLARYPLATRPVRIAANLALDTLKTVHRDRCGGGRAAGVWLAGDQLEPLLEQSRRREGLDHAAGRQALDAAAVIDAGRRLRLIDEGTRGLLRQVYVEGLSGRDAAAWAGTSAGSVRVRCSRAVRRLAAHADEVAEAA
jgi:DNA-directed RNA polymerase specialized sigma24 family protein